MSRSRTAGVLWLIAGFGVPSISWRGDVVELRRAGWLVAFGTTTLLNIANPV